MDLDELKALESKATSGPWKGTKSFSIMGQIDGQAGNPYGHICDAVFPFDSDLICALRNNAKELIRLAEIGKRAVDGNK